MKKKLVSLAVFTALAGGMSAAQAVHVNGDGLGQVLLYPFYSVEGGNDTYVTVVNTTDQTKAVKVRFLEGMNSQEVLDFNLYLSPKDVWVAVISDRGNEDGAAILRTPDTSCTVPQIPADGVAFRNFQYTADSVNGVTRTREGYVEMIEMGTVVDEVAPSTFVPATWAKHVDGEPNNCANLRAAWSQGGGWATNPNRAMEAVSGGLYGSGVLINVDRGTAVAYDATALDDFWSPGGIAHTDPGNILPSLASGVPTANVIEGNQVYTVDFLRGIDAVSATVMRSSIANDYILDADFNGATDWVINFPTKRFYTNVAPAVEGQFGFSAPFTDGWNRRDSAACESVTLDYWDREETPRVPEGIDFSPSPDRDPFALCSEVNVLTFNNTDALFASSRIRNNLNVDFENGWLAMGFDVDGLGRSLTGFGDGEVGIEFRGLPVIGFAVQRYENGATLGGLLANYMGLTNHKATRTIDSNAGFLGE